jgi:hypothetical protein
MAKFLEDPTYVPGTRIDEYPEMYSIFPMAYADKISYYFFVCTTAGYLSSLTYVVYRLNLPNELLIIPSVALIGYFVGPITDHCDFLHYQIFTRWIMIISMFFVTNSLIYYVYESR